MAGSGCNTGFAWLGRGTAPTLSHHELFFPTARQPHCSPVCASYRVCVARWLVWNGDALHPNSSAKSSFWMWGFKLCSPRPFQSADPKSVWPSPAGPACDRCSRLLQMFVEIRALGAQAPPELQRTGPTSRDSCIGLFPAWPRGTPLPVRLCSVIREGGGQALPSAHRARVSDGARGSRAIRASCGCHKDRAPATL